MEIGEEKAAKARDRGLLIAGVRPEHFEDASLVDRDDASDSTFKATVEVVEWLGDEAEIWMDASKMHLFDPATGENLTVDREHAGEIAEHSMAEAAEQPAAAG